MGKRIGQIRPAVLVFIDESGDPGFKIAKGSTPIFAAAMVIFENGTDARATEETIKAVRAQQKVKREFHFVNCRPAVRDAFFVAVRNCPFHVRAVVVQKKLIYSPHLRSDKEDFYRFFVRKMIDNDGGAVQEARIVIDGSGDRPFRNMLKTSLRRHIGDRLKDVKFGRSESDHLIQLADMCVGAIARSYRLERKDADRWREMLRPRIDDIWDFR